MDQRTAHRPEPVGGLHAFDRKVAGRNPLNLDGGDNPHAYLPNPVHWLDPLGLAPDTCMENAVRHKGPATPAGRLSPAQQKDLAKFLGLRPYTQKPNKSHGQPVFTDGNGSTATTSTATTAGCSRWREASRNWGRNRRARARWASVDQPARTNLGRSTGWETSGVQHFKITKYDPAFFGESGSYQRDEWTSRSDVGKSFDGAVLTEAEYQKVEDSYLEAVRLLAGAADVDELAVRELEIRDDTSKWQLGEGQRVTVEEAVEICREMLREGAVWCLLEQGDQFYVHVGYDYYMYVGMTGDPAAAVEAIRRLGLFVEPDWPSPYLP